MTMVLLSALLQGRSHDALKADDGGVFSVRLVDKSQSASKFWKETRTDRIVDQANPRQGVCLDTSFAAAIAAQTCDSAGSGPSSQRMANWANDSSIRYLPVHSPGHTPEGMSCMWQEGTLAVMRPCNATMLITDQYGQWDWKGALNATSGTPIRNRRSQQHVQIVAAPAPAPGPKPPPQPNAGTLPWVNWNLTESHGMKYIEPSRAVRFAANQSYISLKQPVAIVGLDWTNSVGEWFTKSGPNHTNCEAVSRENCRRIKAAGKAQRCCIYHNTELALGWLESQAKAMDDPTKVDYFLQYLDDKGKKNGTIYSEDIVFGRQWFWDHTNPAASDYFVASVVGSLNGSAADCTFTDDALGVPAEHPAVVGRINMTPGQLGELQRATARSFDKLIVELVKAGKYDWQRMAQTKPFSRTACAAWMDAYCEPGRQKDMMIMATGGEADNQSIAAFLITRPPVGFMASRSDTATFMLQPGEPTGLCKKDGEVYSREWTNGIVQLDCGNYTSSMPFPSL